MPNQSIPRPSSGYPHGSQDQAQLALDELFEMDHDGARLLWPDANPGSAIHQPNATTGSRDSSVEFDFSHESPPKEKMPLTQVAKPPVPLVKVAKKTVVPSANVAQKPVEGQKDQDLTITLAIYTPQATTGPVRANAKTKWVSHRFPITKQRINIANSSIDQLKSHLCSIADKIRNDKSGGMSALLKTGDANKELALGVYINNHPIYGKGKFFVVREDEDLEDYFTAVDDNSGAEAGISWTMENPTKAAQSAVDERSLAHTVLKAQNC